MNDDTKYDYCMSDQLWSEMMLEFYNDEEPFVMKPTMYDDPSCQGGATTSSQTGAARTKVETKAPLDQFSRLSLSPSSGTFKSTNPHLAMFTEQTHSFLSQHYSKESAKENYHVGIRGSPSTVKSSFSDSIKVSDHGMIDSRYEASFMKDSRYEASLGVLALGKSCNSVSLIYSPMKVSNTSESGVLRESSNTKRTKRRLKAVRPKRKRKWTPEEDALVVDLCADGFGWTSIAASLNNGKTGTNVRERYINVLDPTLNKGEWTLEEDEILYYHQGQIGNKWQQISTFLPGRSENSVKNRWYGLQRAKEKNRDV